MFFDMNGLDMMEQTRLESRQRLRDSYSLGLSTNRAMAEMEENGTISRRTWLDIRMSGHHEDWRDLADKMYNEKKELDRCRDWCLRNI